MIKRRFQLLRNRKAQVTAFMIIGIIILFSTALVFYIKGKMQVPEEELIPALEEIPSVLKPVRQYVERCASEKIEEGIYKAMEHGGLLYTDELFVDIAEPLEGEGVEYYPGSDYKVPYWAYLKSKTGCTGGCEIASKMPPLCKAERTGCIVTGDKSVEEQLERYLREEMKVCIGNFGELASQGYKIKELSNITASVNIRQKDTVALIKYELEVEKDGTSSKIIDYYAAVPSRITEMYETAIEVVNYTTRNCLYERYTADIISAYSGIGTKLPPLSQVTFESNAQKWQMFNVKEELKKITTHIVPMLRISNASNGFPPLINSSGEYRITREAAFDRAIYNALSQYKDVNFYHLYYPWWDVYIDIKPRDGNTIGPSNEVESSGDESDLISEVLEALGYKEYFLTYTFSYPIVIEIMFTDDTEEKHIFRYAQEVNMIGNTCIKPSTSLLSSPAGRSKTILCDEDMREPGNTTIKVYDDFNRTKKLEDVKVTYYAGEMCNLGYSDAEGRLDVRMPQAYGYFIIFEKKGYLKQVIHESDIQKPIKVYLKPLASKKINIMTINSTTVDKIKAANTTAEARNIVLREAMPLNGSYDYLTIKLERVQDSYTDPVIKKLATYRDYAYKPAEVELTTGRYSVDIRMMDGRNHTLVKELDRKCAEGDAGGSCVKTPVDPDCSPRGDSEDDFREGDCYIRGYTCEDAEDARDKGSEAEDDDYEACIAVWITGYGAGECYNKDCETDEEIEYPSENITNIISGGVVLDNTTKYFRITDQEQITDTENITFYIFRQEIPVRHHELEYVMLHEDWSATYADYVMPVLR